MLGFTENISGVAESADLQGKRNDFTVLNTAINSLKINVRFCLSFPQTVTPKRKAYYMAKLGYIRTSTDTQITDRQYNRLFDVCDQVYVEDGVSAISKSRPVYKQVMDSLKPGDVFVVSSLDRAFRSSLDALAELEKLQKQGIEFLSLSQNFDTTTPDGKFLFTLAAALAEWERQILSQRTKEGLAAAKLRGKKLGRPKKLTDEQIQEARRAIECKFYSSITEMAENFRVHEMTLKRALRR